MRLHLNDIKDAALVDLTDHHPDAAMALTFHKTRRVAEDGRSHGLPPSLGHFPLIRFEDASPAVVSADMRRRQGLIMPIHDTEAMWINFENPRSRSFGFFGGAPDFPFAIQVAAGKICAITGRPLNEGLYLTPKEFNYFVAGIYSDSGRQKWLDGFKTGDGKVRQFVAAKLGEGKTVEYHLTGKEDIGGLQVLIRPMRLERWEQVKAERAPVPRGGGFLEAFGTSKGIGAQSFGAMRGATRGMGLGAGGQIDQQIVRPSFHPEDFDQTTVVRLWINLCHAGDWTSLTGQATPYKPHDPRPSPAPGPDKTPVAGIPGMVPHEGISTGHWGG